MVKRPVAADYKGFEGLIVIIIGIGTVNADPDVANYLGILRSAEEPSRTPGAIRGNLVNMPKLGGPPALASRLRTPLEVRWSG